MEPKKCKVCEKIFTPRVASQTCCSKECSEISCKQATKAYHDNKREERIRRKNPNQALVEYAVEARKLGMSYGQYVGMIEGGVIWQG